MMIHHGTQPYEVAATEAARVMREKLETLIHRGQTSAESVIGKIMGAQPIDRVVNAQALQFGVDGSGIVASNRAKSGAAPIHDHALAQIASRADLPWSYAQHLRGSDWGRALLAQNLNELYSHESAERRYLMRFARTENGTPELRGFLSDKYRRLDARPITEALTGALSRAGALPYEGVATDTRVSLRAILPTLFEPVPGEVLAFGLDYQTSDYGDGALTVGLFVLRMMCTNLATAEDMLRQVHLGRRLSDDLTFSEATYRLDTQTMASAVGDVVGNVLAPATVERYCNAIRQADAEKINGFQVGAKLKTLGLTKVEQEATVEAFNSPNIEEVPAGSSVWRFSNALSWVAGNTQDARRRMELQRVAGSVMKIAA